MRTMSVSPASGQTQSGKPIPARLVINQTLENSRPPGGHNRSRVERPKDLVNLVHKFTIFVCFSSHSSPGPAQLTGGCTLSAAAILGLGDGDGVSSPPPLLFLLRGRRRLRRGHRVVRDGRAEDAVLVCACADADHRPALQRVDLAAHCNNKQHKASQQRHVLRTQTIQAG